MIKTDNAAAELLCITENHPAIIIAGDWKLPVLGDKDSQFAQSTHSGVWEKVESYFTKWLSHLMNVVCPCLMYKVLAVN